MSTIADIIALVEQLAPPFYQENYDNSGLIIGDKNKKVKKVLLTLDCIESVVDEAIELGCQLIIAHHPIVFKGLKSITGKNYVERTILKAIKKDIAIYACHTNLDNVYTGVNQKIADKLGLINTRILVPKKQTLKQLYTYAPLSEAENIRQALFKSGAGNIGNYQECSFNIIGLGTFKAMEGAQPFLGEVNEAHEEKEVKIELVFPTHLQTKVLNALHQAHPYEEIAYGVIDIDIPNQMIGTGLIGELSKHLSNHNFLKHLKNKMKTASIRHTEEITRDIKTVAICGGSGSFLLADAMRNGADAFVSADFKYHEFFDAENQIFIADVGHFESEQFTGEIFYDLLSKKNPTFAVLKSTVNTNPVKYYS